MISSTVAHWQDELNTKQTNDVHQTCDQLVRVHQQQQRRVKQGLNREIHELLKAKVQIQIKSNQKERTKNK
jgi:hypothetical protein